MDRDWLLTADEVDFLKRCRVECALGSGHGGQHRNKTATAVRIVLLENPGFAASDCSERSQLRNKQCALRKLRMLLALRCRVTPAQIPARLDCALAHPDYPLMAARCLDLLVEVGGDDRLLALRCGISRSALGKRLRRDPDLWQAANAIRAEFDLPPLH